MYSACTRRPEISYVFYFFTYTCTFTNIYFCSFLIYQNVVDTTPPTVIQGPETITRVIELGDGGVIVSWEDLAVTDSSGTQTLISRSNSPDSFFPVGDTSVTYLYGDESGNTVTYTFCVTVQPIDTVPPTISNCPQQVISVTIELGQSTGVAVWTEPTATDLSGSSTLSSRTAAPGDDFVIGQTTVVYTFVDASNNMATCVFTVNVETGLSYIFCAHVIFVILQYIAKLCTGSCKKC
ncbi:Hyalin [Holothuria leucospilota]|uniref:Hyalin n=1 Tax=Holothuria leucospilota TaxID=206669 RepID=A0A9Q1B8H5_HOLLE|nr:Hyalin [Holothuria leucospilota]